MDPQSQWNCQGVVGNCVTFLDANSSFAASSEAASRKDWGWPSKAPEIANGWGVGRKSKPALKPERASVASRLDGVDLPEDEDETEFFLLSLVRKVKEKKTQTDAKIRIISRLRTLVRKIRKDADIQAFGSSAANIGLTGSDIDMTLLFNEGPLDLDLQDEYAFQLSELLREEGMVNVSPIRAAVPICKFTDPESGVCGDITINRPLGVEKAAFIRLFVDAHPLVAPFLMLVKHWAHQRGLVGAFHKHLPSHTFVVMALFVLQTLPSPIIPSLHLLAKDPQGGRTVDGVALIHCSDPQIIANWVRSHRVVDPPSLTELLATFFYLFGYAIEWAADVVSIREARFLSVDEAQWAEVPAADRRVAVQDPFCPENNLGVVVNLETRGKLVFELQRAYEYITTGQPEAVFLSIHDQFCPQP
eukprot:GCRY01003157.1.p1 GENE.GCRY01003157.1~~GCRY01003157.1.p1  ORF type:complete len:417 (-),score=91.31 GCRY01003157.1:153-1403(-)